jgi:hypothetical protein
MYSEKLENLINHALADGVLTEKEMQVLMRNAKAEGIDPDEFEMVLEARLYKREQESNGDVKKSDVDIIKSPQIKSIILGNDFILKLNDLYSNKLLKRIEQFNDAYKPHDAIRALDASILKKEYVIAINNCFDHLLTSAESVLFDEHVNYIKKRRDSFLSDDSKTLFDLLSKLNEKAETVISKVSNSTIGGILKAATTGATTGSIIPGLGTVTGTVAGAIAGGISAWVEGDKEDKILEAWDAVKDQTMEQYDLLWERLCEVVDEISENTPIDFDIDDDVFEEKENPIETIIRENLTVDDDSLYFYENIPAKKKTNAKSSYVTPLDDDEAIICLYDSTIFGSAKEGICLTTKAIYWKSLAQEGQYIGYTDINKVKLKEDDLFINGMTVEVCDFKEKLRKTLNKVVKHIKLSLDKENQDGMV